MKRPKILVIGFGPFPGAPTNPSTEVALSLAHSKRAARLARVRAMAVPTVYAEIAKFPGLIAKEKTYAVLMFGLARRARALRIETRGKNRASLLHPDAAGRKGKRVLVPRAARTLPVTAPGRGLLAAARAAGAKARLSSDAGDYICNAALFYALHASERKNAPLVAFVHIPLPSAHGKDGTRPAMATLRRAAEAILVSLARTAKTSA